MTNSFALPRNLIIFAVLVPLALLVGYLLATPTDTVSFIGVGFVVIGVLLPLLLRWHHSMVIVGWNMAVTIFFLPGQPYLWMPLVVVSVAISFLDWLLTKKPSFLYVPSLTWSLVALGLVTLVTAKITGGIGIRALGGDSYGGKQYLLILLAITGFFALVFKRLDPAKAKLLVALFFLSGVTPIVSSLAYYAGPGFYFVYWAFPATYAAMQAQADWMVGSAYARLSAFAPAGQALMVFLLQRYGIQGLLKGSKPWRSIVFLLILFATLLGGYRSNIIIAGVLITALFFIERLYRTRIIVGAVAILIVLGAFLFPNATRLPLAVQRSLSVLPIEVDPIASYDAQASTEWRLRMWRYLMPEVPKHLWRPKGFSLDPTELYLVTEANRRGLAEDVDVAIASGSYHNGPISLLLGLGVWGAAAFTWVIVAGLVALYRNYRFGAPEFSNINGLLLAFFIARLIYFLFVFGHFSEDLYVFTGILGLSISLNGGVRRFEELQAPSAVQPEPSLLLPEPVAQ